ncbi:lysophospholipid acyltransferase family protein [Sphingobacterium sp. Mn56C]|uniref:lysophospholipid acyltransferase family protein n=1 Tax=Sphingobacterium sp. Mn56C TaxID=3395261 RepID=UPI003BBDF2F6
MAKLLRKTHSFLYYTAVFLCFSICFPILYILKRQPDKYYRTIAGIRKWMTLSAASLVGFRFKVDFEEEIDWSKPMVICPNHTSIVDITAIIHSCQQPISFMGKSDLLTNPVTGIFFKTIDIAVNRSSKISSFRAFKKAEAFLKMGRSVVIFPEGKIDEEYPPQLHAFKSGPFRLALENKVQILPVVIKDAWKMLWDDGSKFGSAPGRIHIHVLKPIDTALLNPQQLEDLQASVYADMQEIWNKK